MATPSVPSVARPSRTTAHTGRPPKVPLHTELLRFDGLCDYPIEDVVDDWGLNAQQQETYVELFRRRLVQEGIYNADKHDFYTLRRFLRARGYDFDKATKMFSDHVQWREEHNVDTLLTDFYFNERDKFLEAYPQGYHKLDKMGRPIYIQLIGKVNVPAIMACTTEERMFKFHVQEYERCVRVIMPVASRLAGRKVDQTFGIMDVRGVGMSHLTANVRNMLGKFTKTDQDNYPEMLGHICIINAPTVFQWVWAIVKGMIDKRTQEKIEILGTNYMDALKKWVDEDAIPTWLGGTSEGTLLDDVGPWNDTERLAALGLDLEALRTGQSPAAAQVQPATSFGQASSFVHAGPAAAAAADGGVAAAAGQERAVPAGLQPTTSAYYSPQGSMIRRREGSTTEGNGEVAIVAAAADGVAAHLASIAEMRSRTLVERIKAIEALLPAQSERLRAQVAVTARGESAVSTRSAPGGSLLGRVEVMEEALETLLVAQQAALAEERQRVAAAEEARDKAVRELEEFKAHAKAQGRCCTIM